MSIWPDPSKEARIALQEQIRNAGYRLNLIDEKLQALEEGLKGNLIELEKRLDGASAKISLLANSGGPKEISELRTELDALKLWRAQIMTMLTEQSAAGRPRLNKTGKTLRGFFGR